MKEKIFFLYLKTGGGHFAPAKAVANYLENKFSMCFEPVLIDGLSGCSKYVRSIVEDGYRILQNKAKWYYEFLYGLNKIIGLAKINNQLVAWSIKPLLAKKILNEKPAKIIIFHFFLIKPVFEILKENKLDIPIITVVTDPYTAHPVWFLNKTQDFIVFSNELKKYAISKGIPQNKLHLFPFILDEKYSTPLSKDKIPDIKEKYGFDPKKKMILIIGGGDGIPKGELILKKIVGEIDNADIAIICGKNKKLFEFSTKLKEKGGYNNLKVFAYVDFIYELFNMSELVVTKCGASTFMEILLSRKIPIVNSYIWEQEKGNVEFLVKNKFGIFEKNIGRLPFIIKQLMTDTQMYNAYIENIDKANLISGTTLVGDFIADFTG